MQKKNVYRHINFRAFLVIGIAIIFSIFSALLVTVINWLGWLLLAIEITFFAFLAIYYYAKDYKIHKVITFIITIFVILIVFINFTVRVNSWLDKNFVNADAYAVNGRVDNIYINDDSETVVVLRKVSFDGNKISGKVELKIKEGTNPILEFVQVGDIINLSSKVYGLNLIDDLNVNANYFRTDIRYRCYVKTKCIEPQIGKQNILEKLNTKIENTLYSALGEHIGPLAYGMLIGDKYGMSEQTRDYFSASGLSHLLAVSGLHIGFIAAVIMFLLKKLRAKKSVSFTVTTVFLVFYMILAGFSPSVVRAVIMTEIAMLSTLIGKSGDRITSLMFAFTVILVVAPLFLFEAGFVLSVSAVLGIILFADSITKALRKIKIPNFIAKAFALSFSVQIGILPASICFFSVIQLYSIFVNMILMPLISVTFIAIFLTLILAMIAPFFSILLSISGVGLSFIDTVAHAVSLIPFALIKLNSTKLIFVCYPLYFLISKFFMLKSKKKFVNLGLSILCVLIALNGFVFFPKPEMNYTIIPISGYNDVTSIAVYDNKTYIVGDFTSAKAISYSMDDYMLNDVELILLTVLNLNVANQLVKFDREFKINMIYCHPSKIDSDALQILFSHNIKNFYTFYDELPSPFSVIREPYNDDEKFLGYSLKTEKCNILFCGYKTSYEKLDSEIIDNHAIIRTYLYKNIFPKRIFLTNMEQEKIEVAPDVLLTVNEIENGSYFNFLEGIIMGIKN